MELRLISELKKASESLSFLFKPEKGTVLKLSNPLLPSKRIEVINSNCYL
jgi:hypothetical protein